MRAGSTRSASSTGLTFFALCTCSFYTGVGCADPPVAVLTDEGSKAVVAFFTLCACCTRSTCRAGFTFFALCTLCTCGFHAGVGRADPPVAIFANERSKTIVSLFTLRAGSTRSASSTGLTFFALCTCSFYTGVGCADPPVSVCANERSKTIVTLRTLFAGVTLVAFFALCSNKRCKPFRFRTFVSISYGNFISRLAIRSVIAFRAYKTCKPRLYIALITILNSEFICRLTICTGITLISFVALFDSRAILAYKGSEPFSKRTLKSCLTSKIVSRFTVSTIFTVLTVTAVCSVQTIFANQRIEPLSERTLKSIIASKLISGLAVLTIKTIFSVSTIFSILTVGSACSCRTFLSDQRSKPLIESSGIAIFDSEFIC